MENRAYNRNQPVRPNQPRSDNKPVTPKKEPPKPKVPGIETTLVGKRVRITALDFQKSITGVLIKCEKYLYVVQNEKLGTIAVLKHAISMIGGIKDKEEGEKPTE